MRAMLAVGGWRLGFIWSKVLYYVDVVHLRSSRRQEKWEFGDHFEFYFLGQNTVSALGRVKQQMRHNLDHVSANFQMRCGSCE